MLSSPYVSGTGVRFESRLSSHVQGLLPCLGQCCPPCALYHLPESSVSHQDVRSEWQSAFIANVSATVRSVRLSHLSDCYPLSIPHVMGYQEGPWTFRGRYYKDYSHIFTIECIELSRISRATCRALYQLNLVPVEEVRLPVIFVTATNCLDIPLRGARVRRQRSTFPATFR